MPLKRCTSNGKSGWKWGNSGKCYPGKEGKKKAIAQALSYDKENFLKETTKAGLEIHEIQHIMRGEDCLTGYKKLEEPESKEKNDEFINKNS